ncbi:MAG: beta-lactamase family protein [Verrucomicrobia bacterium]|nr:beta-lactamase family protein [Verrucomicrobiota bacterium]
MERLNDHEVEHWSLEPTIGSERGRLARTFGMNSETRGRTARAPVRRFTESRVSQVFHQIWKGLFVLQVAVVCLAASDDEDLSSKVNRYMEKLAKAGQFSGSILIARDGEVLVSQGYSLANREHEIPNTPQTKFRLGSLTKQFTAMSILLLQEDGKLSVRDPVCRHVPDCPEAWKPITIHHLLTHSSGIPGFTEFPDNEQFERLPTTVTNTVNRFRDKPLEFDPGSRFKYSNSGYVLLGYIIERASGQSYESFLRERIFKPLRMENSGYDHPWMVLRHRASGYAKRDGQLANCVYFEMDTPHAAGALYSTVEDLLVWNQALDRNRFVSKKSLEAMFTPEKGGYGYGWVIRQRFGRKCAEHGGGISGFSTFIERYPLDKVVVIVLSNYQFAVSGQIAHHLAGVVFGEPVP